MHLCQGAYICIFIYTYISNSQEFPFSNKNSFETSPAATVVSSVSGQAFLWEAETEAKELKRRRPREISESTKSLAKDPRENKN